MENNEQNTERTDVPLPLPQEGFARLPQILYVLGISASTWWSGIRAGKFPKPLKLGTRTTVWKVELIQKLSEGR